MQESDNPSVTRGSTDESSLLSDAPNIERDTPGKCSPQRDGATTVTEAALPTTAVDSTPPKSAEKVDQEPFYCAFWVAFFLLP